MNAHQLNVSARWLRAAILAMALLLLTTTLEAQVEIASIPRAHSTGLSYGPVASIGDVDGDAVADVVSLIHQAQDILPFVCVVEVRSGRTGAVIWMYGQTDSLESFTSYASSADVDGDGVQDVLACAPGPGKSGGQLVPGYVVALSGKNGTLLLKVSGARIEDQFASRVAGLGDVNGDGKDDFVVSALSERSSPGIVVGAAHVYSGATGAELYVVSEGTSTWFGKAVAGIGDCNGDSIPDFAVGAPYEDNGADIQAGAVHVYSGANGAVLWRVAGMGWMDQLGYRVRAVGDVNADGLGDVLVDSNNAPDPSHSPALLVRSGLDGSPLHQFVGHLDFEGSADACAAGDTDDDGYGDIALGNGFSLMAFSGRTGARLWMANGNAMIGGLAHSLVNAGDLNGDGVSDLAVSADSFNPSTIPDTIRGFTTTCGKTVAFGASCPASNGAIPNLTVTGSPCLTPRGTGVTLRIDMKVNPAAPAFGLLFLSPLETALPFPGGCTMFVGPTPLVSIVVPLLFGGFPNSISLGPVPPSVPLSSFVAQAFRADSGLPAGYYATNGVRLTID